MRFRSEFQTSKKADSLGSIVVSSRKAVGTAAFVFLLGTFAVIILVFSVNYSQYEKASGYVAEYGFKHTVSSPLPIPGTVLELYVKPGDSLGPGKAIARVALEKKLEQTQFVSSANSFFFFPDVKDDEKSKYAVISSTVSGKVENILVRQGGSVSPMQPVVTASTSEGRTYFQVLASGSVVSHTAIGKKIIITLPDLAQSKKPLLQGEVIRISRTSLSPIEVSSLFGIPPPPSPKFLVDVVVSSPLTIDQIKVIRPGMSVVASIKTKERTIASWIFEK